MSSDYRGLGRGNLVKILKKKKEEEKKIDLKPKVILQDEQFIASTSNSFGRGTILKKISQLSTDSFLQADTVSTISTSTLGRGRSMFLCALQKL
jgi:hypothetical protein